MINALVRLSLLVTVPVGLSFTPWFTSHGVDVQIARPGGSPPWVRGSTELPARAERVMGVLTDFRHYQEIFSPALKQARVLEAHDATDARLHLVWPYPFPLRNRDAIVVYQGETLENGKFRLAWKSEAKPEDPHEGVRIEHVAGETLVEPLGAERCRVTYTYLGDLGGKFPASVQEKAWREEPVQYIRALHRRLGLPDTAP